MVRTGSMSKQLLTLLAACALACGCGGNGNVDGRVTTGGANGAGGSSGGSSGGSTTGSAGTTSGTGTTTGSTTGTTTSSGGNSGTSGDAGFCAADATKAQLLPLDIYIMLDQSGSMSETNSAGTSKWTNVTNALTAFVNQSGLNGVSVGLQYFAQPLSSCPSSCTNASGSEDEYSCEAGGGYCNSNNVCKYCSTTYTDPYSGNTYPTDSCYAADYTSAEVEIAPLPGVASQITGSMSQHSPYSSTPTSAALQGAINHAKSWAGSHPNHAVVDVLATDGQPTECDTTISDIDAIAAAGVNSSPKILTYVIGVGSSLSNLNSIAQAGGTNQAYIVDDTSSNANQQFLDALNNIRGAALGCQYTIPTPDAGTIDYSQVNVQYTPGSGGAAQVIPNVASQSACPSSGDAWYYDNPSAPTQIILCPSTCTTVSADSSGEVDILTGCQTIFK